jgi:hypothetical protein
MTPHAAICAGASHDQGAGTSIEGTMQRIALASLAVAGLALTACTYDRAGPIQDHYTDFKALMPRGNTIWQCRSYGCRMQTRFRFNDQDIATIASIIAKTKKADTPHEERRGVAYAIAWMDKRVGDVTGTSGRRPGDDFEGSGDPTQTDCVDTATNTTSYLLVLESNSLLRHHIVGTPFAKEDLTRGVAGWPHWTAVLKENLTGQRWAVDGWMFPTGENPAIVETEKWYIEEPGNHKISMR